MPNFRELESFVADNYERPPMSTQQGFPLGEAANFFMWLKKEAAVLDTTGILEGEFVAPLEDVVAVMCQLVATEFKTQLAYITYAATLRDLSHGSIAEEFEDHASKEVEHAKYLLRRLSVLAPGQVMIPPYETPAPMTEPQQIIGKMIEMEQGGIALWRKLHSMVGENPTKYTIENFLQDEQEHLDELWQLMPAGAPKVAAASKLPRELSSTEEASLHGLMRAAATAPKSPLKALSDATADDRRRLIEGAGGKGSGARLGKLLDKWAGVDTAYINPALLATAPNMSPEFVALREAALNGIQAQNEKSNLEQKLKDLRNQLQLAATRAQSAENTTQALQMSMSNQNAMLSQENQLLSQQNQMAQQQAMQATQQATQMSQAMMTMKMRVDQLRQQLAAIAQFDPTQDAMAAMGPDAAMQMQAAGVPNPMAQDPSGQGMPPEAAAQQQQMAAQQQGAAPGGGPQAPQKSSKSKEK